MAPPMPRNVWKRRPGSTNTEFSTSVSAWPSDNAATWLRTICRVAPCAVVYTTTASPVRSSRSPACAGNAIASRDIISMVFILAPRAGQAPHLRFRCFGNHLLRRRVAGGATAAVRMAGAAAVDAHIVHPHRLRVGARVDAGGVDRAGPVAADGEVEQQVELRGD